MSSQSPETMLTRRNALKTGAGAGAAALGLSGAGLPQTVEPVEDAEAVAPIVVWGAAAVGGIATGWALRELEVIGADDVTDGLGPDALWEQVWGAARKRLSTWQSTVIDNKNLIKYVPETAFSEGKIAALNAIKDGKSESEAKTVGKAEAKKHMATIEGNLLRSWNELVQEFANWWDAVSAHDNLSTGNVFRMYDPRDGTSTGNTLQGYNLNNSYTLRDNSTMDVHALTDDYSNNLNPIDSGTDYLNYRVDHPDHLSDGTYHDFYRGDPATTMWTNMQTTFDDILSNIDLWVSNTYSGISTGDISPGEYLSSVDLANTIAADAKHAQAVADLVAMNVPGEYGTPVTIKLEADDAKMTGYLATTDTSNVGTLTEGMTIDPSNSDYGTWYFAFKREAFIKSHSNYDSDFGVQDGMVRFTSDPTVNSDGEEITDDWEYIIETTEDETARVKPSEFTETTDDSSNTVWEVDISDQIETTIADVLRVRSVYVGDNQELYGVEELNQQFTIIEIDGADSIEIQQHRDPQTDNNYISDEEWQALLDQQELLIERFEEADSGGGGIDLGEIDVPTLGPLDSIEDWGLAAIAAVVGSAVFGNLS